MLTCWAASLNDCGEEQSREHLVSQSLWEGDGVEVIGLPWCKDEAKRVGLGSLTSKILCRHHNSGLSPLDGAAGAAFDALRRATALGNERAKLRPRKWKVRRFEALGLLLERWFLKTAINVVYTHPAELSWELTGRPATEVPQPLVHLAFGLSSFERPMGLYVVGDVGEDIYMSDMLEFAPLLIPDNRVFGGVFVFRGVRFYLHLDPRPMPPILRLPTKMGGRWLSGQLLYHLKEVNFRIAKKRSHYVQFLWHQV